MALKIERLRAFMTRDKDRPRVIVAIDTEDGVTGWGECYNHGPDKALLPLLDYLFGFIKGQDASRVEYLINILMQQSRFPRVRWGSRVFRRSIIACGTSRPRPWACPSTR